MPIYSNEGGVIYEHTAVPVNNGGVLVEQDTVHSNEGGVLFEIFSASNPTNIKWTADTTADSHAKIISTTSDGLSVVFTASSHVMGQTTDINDHLSIVSKPFQLAKSAVVGITINSFSGNASKYGRCNFGAYKYNESSFEKVDYVSCYQSLRKDPQSCGRFMNMQLEPGKYYFVLQACWSYSASFSTQPSTGEITTDITITYPDSYNNKYHYQQ